MADRRRPVRAVLVGAAGRMGRAIAAVAAASREIEIAAAIVAPGSPNVGRDFGELAFGRASGIAIGSDLAAALREVDVALDFSHADAAAAHLEACRAARKPLLLGTTGLPESLEGKLDAAAREVALLVAPNTSLGIAVLLDLVRRAARALPPEYDADVFEAHHRHKRDAPSGTALALGEAIVQARGGKLAGRRATARDDGGARQAGEVGFAVIRAGDIVGEHEVRLAGAGEQLLLAHRATDRAVFARGAAQAAAWLASQPPGRYAMGDVIGTKSMA